MGEPLQLPLQPASPPTSCWTLTYIDSKPQVSNNQSETSISKPQFSKPQFSKPQVSKPQFSKPQVSKPQFSKPEVLNINQEGYMGFGDMCRDESMF